MMWPKLSAQKREVLGRLYAESVARSAAWPQRPYSAIDLARRFGVSESFVRLEGKKYVAKQRKKGPVEKALEAFDASRAHAHFKTQERTWGYGAMERIPSADDLKELAGQLLALAAVRGSASSGGLEATRTDSGELSVSLRL